MNNISKVHDIFMYIVILTCCACYYLKDVGFTYDSTWERFVYMFAHANGIHLFINVLTFFTLTQYMNGTLLQYTPFAIAVLATFGSENDMQTVGLSGVLYAMLATCAYYFDKYRWKIILGAISVNAFYMIFGNVNVILHSLCFLYSLIITFLYERFYQNRFQG